MFNWRGREPRENPAILDERYLARLESHLGEAALRELLSDGRLASPGTTDRNQVVMAVRRWNRVRQIRFVVISVGPSDDSVLGWRCSACRLGW